MSGASKLRALVRLARGDSEKRWVVAEQLARIAHRDAVLGEHAKRWRSDPEFVAATRTLHARPRQWERLYALDQLAARSATLPGDFAECGTHSGTSAFFLCRRASGSVHLFDSWAGLSIPSEADGHYWSGGDLKSSLDAAQQTLDGFTNVSFHRGWIPERFNDVVDRRFSLVHVDVDLYQPTLDSVVFFWERINGGGVLVCDDYGFDTCPGATAAIDEFFGRRAPIVRLPTGQAVIIR